MEKNQRTELGSDLSQKTPKPDQNTSFSDVRRFPNAI